MLITVPRLRGLHEHLVLARLDSIERLVADAQHVTGIEVVIVVEEQHGRVSVGVLAGALAVVEVAEAAPWACWFMGARPWVPLLICPTDRAPMLSFAWLGAAGRTGS